MMSKFRQVKTTKELDDELKEIFQVIINLDFSIINITISSKGLILFIFNSKIWDLNENWTINVSL